MAASAPQGRALRTLVGAGMAVIIVAGMKAAASLLVPALMAGFLAIICWPPLKWLQDHRVPTIVALLIIVLAIAIVGGLVGGLIGTSVNDFISDLPKYEEGLRAQQKAFVEWIEDKGVKVPKWLQSKLPTDDGQTMPAVADIESDMAPNEGNAPNALIVKTSNENATDDEQPVFNIGYAVRMFGNLVGTLNSFMRNGVVILLILVFMLFEAAGLPAKMAAISGRDQGDAEGTNQIADRIRRYVALKTIISLLTGALIVLLLKILGVKYAVMWGVLAFFFNFIPTIGSFIAAVPAVLFAMLDGGLSTAVWAGAGFLTVNGVVGNIIEPRVLGRGLGLSTLVVFLSLVFWGWVFGPIGMLLSVPLTMIAKIAAESSPETRWLSILLSSDASVAEMASQEK